MRLGLFTVVDAYPELPGRGPERVVELAGLAQEAEAAGLSSFWVAEHHFRNDGACPAPALLLVACGARTSSLRLGSLVSVLPFHRPVDVAEEYALVDRLIGGRLNFGVGSGYLASEFAGFGIDPAEKRDRFDDALRTIRRAWAGEPIRVGGGHGPEVTLNVRPVQQPHPPIWVAVQRREAVAHVARQGFSVALIPYATVDGLRELGEVIADYRRARPSGDPGNVAVSVHLYAGERPELAREAFQRYVRTRLEGGSTHLGRKAQDRPEHASPEAIERSGLAVFGDAEQLVRGLQQFERLGVDELLGVFDFGGLPREEAVRSLHLAGQEWARRRREEAAGPPTDTSSAKGSATESP